MGGVVLLIVLGLVVAAVVVLPIWRTRRRKAVSLLARYQAITSALLENDWARAREELKAIIRADTEDIPAYLTLVRVLQRSGDSERAVAVGRSLLARDLRDREAKLAVHHGLLADLVRLRRFDEASRLAEELRHLDRRSPLLARFQLEIALERNEGEAALQALDRLRKSDEEAHRREAPRVKTLAAALALDRGDRREARRLLEETLEQAEGHAPALVLLADLLYDEGQHEQAVALMTEFIRRQPGATGALLSRLERGFFELGRFGELERFLESVVAEGRAAAPLYLALARMAIRKGDAGRALGWIEDLLQQEPEHSAAKIWQLYLLGEAGRGAEVRRLLRQAVDGSLAAAEVVRCPACGASRPLTELRCGACRAWLPDSVSGPPAEPPAGG